MSLPSSTTNKECSSPNESTQTSLCTSITRYLVERLRKAKHPYRWPTERSTKRQASVSPNKRFKFLINDPDFDCDMYVCRLKDDELPLRTEPDNMSEWMFYPW